MSSEIFLCARCNKKKSKSCAYGTTYNHWHGNKACPDCGKIKQRGVSMVERKGGVNKRIYVGCLECNPVVDDDENIWFTDRVCCECFFEWREKRKQTCAEKNDLLTNLAQENQELKQQLAEVQKQLAEVLTELKKLKGSPIGKDNKKLDQQIAQNQKLIKNGEKVSQAEVKEQVQKSQALLKEASVSVVSTKDNQKDNSSSSLPYLIGGSVVVISVLTSWLLTKKRTKT